MLQKPLVPILSVRLRWDDASGTAILQRVEEQRRPSCRAFRLVSGSTSDEGAASKRFLTVVIPSRMPREALRAWLSKVVKEGLHVKELGCRFTSIGCTESGIKEGHWLFFRENSKYTVKSLLENFGDLPSVYRTSGPGKYAARLGLSFSSTISSIDIPDYKARDGNLTSDGCCIIRESYAVLVRKACALPTRTAVFHFRRGGIKGILVAYPDSIFDDIISQYAQRLGAPASRFIIAYRPSMLKYQGGPAMLDILGVPDSCPPPARLNNAFVVQLLSLNVDVKALQKLTTRQVESVKILSTDRNEAIRHIHGEFDAKGDGFGQDVFEMLLAGHSMTEPYLQTCLRRMQQNQCETLRNKLLIEVPKSCYVFGVVDEQNILKDDEVYINLPEKSGVLEGPVFITRNPCYRPSDVRRMKAVNYEELNFLPDCIVFPRSGQISVPNAMAGGDLDGDKYFVCWDRKIMPPLAESVPASYSRLDSAQKATPKPPVAKKWDDARFDEALVEMFVQLRNDNLLGKASNEWQRVVERTPGFANGKYPLELATIIETALDITKTGEDAHKLWQSFKALQQRFGGRVDTTRHSPTDGLRAMIPNFNGKKNAFLPTLYPIDADLTSRLRNGSYQQVWEKYYDEGKRLIKAFNLELSEAINADGNENEAHRAIAKRGKDSRRAEDIKKKYVAEHFPPSSSILSKERIFCYLRASAWYQVGYELGKPAFAWLGARYLNEIKAFATNNGAPGITIGALGQRHESTPPPSSRTSDIPRSTSSSSASIRTRNTSLHSWSTRQSASNTQGRATRSRHSNVSNYGEVNHTTQSYV